MRYLKNKNCDKKFEAKRLPYAIDQWLTRAFKAWNTFPYVDEFTSSNKILNNVIYLFCKNRKAHKKQIIRHLWECWMSDTNTIKCRIKHNKLMSITSKYLMHLLFMILYISLRLCLRSIKEFIKKICYISFLSFQENYIFIYFEYAAISI